MVWRAVRQNLGVARHERLSRSLACRLGNRRHPDLGRNYSLLAQRVDRHVRVSPSYLAGVPPFLEALMTAQFRPSLIDQQRMALAEVADCAQRFSEWATRLDVALVNARTLGLVIPLVPATATVKQRAVLEHVQANYPTGVPNDQSREAVCLDIAVDILAETGLSMDAKTVARTLKRFGLTPD